MGSSGAAWRAPLSERQQLRLLASQQPGTASKNAYLFPSDEPQPKAYDTWDSARKRAWARRQRDPERYLMRWSGGANEDDVSERQGLPWGEKENTHFLSMLKSVADGSVRVGGRGWAWGAFSARIPGRSGSECRSRYRALVKAGTLDGVTGQVKGGDVTNRASGSGNAVFLSKLVRRFAPVILPSAVEAKEDFLRGVATRERQRAGKSEEECGKRIARHREGAVVEDISARILRRTFPHASGTILSERKEKCEASLPQTLQGDDHESLDVCSDIVADIIEASSIEGTHRNDVDASLPEANVGVVDEKVGSNGFGFGSAGDAHIVERMLPSPESPGVSSIDTTVDSHDGATEEENALGLVEGRDDVCCEADTNLFESFAPPLKESLTADIGPRTDKDTTKTAHDVVAASHRRGSSSRDCSEISAMRVEGRGASRVNLNPTELITANHCARSACERVEVPLSAAEKKERKRKRKEKERRRKKKRKTGSEVAWEVWGDALHGAFVNAKNTAKVDRAVTDEAQQQPSESDDEAEEMDMVLPTVPIAASVGRKRVDAFSPLEMVSLSQSLGPSVDKPPLPHRVHGAKGPSSGPPRMLHIPPPRSTSVDFRRELALWSRSCSRKGAELGHAVQRRHVLIAFDGEYRRCRHEQPLVHARLVNSYRQTMDEVRARQYQELQTMALLSDYIAL